MTKSDDDKIFTAACVQLNVGPSQQDNWVQTESLVREAVSASGAQLVITPECTDFLQPDRTRLLEHAQTQSDSFTVQHAKILAKDLSIWLILGSLMLRQEEGDLLVNRQVMIDPSGQVAAIYNKIHMFDVEVGDGQHYRESDIFQPGSQMVLSQLPWGILGHSICYDVRFAYLYRKMAQSGADFLVTPAAFTKITGQAHWHIFQRARAIETGCFVFAANQCGTHANNRQTYGHSLIVDPWGRVLAEGSAIEPGWIAADIELSLIRKARQQVPSLQHDREIL